MDFLKENLSKGKECVTYRNCGIVCAGIGFIMALKYISIKHNRKQKKLPPGPIGIPFLGGSIITMLTKGFVNYFEEYLPSYGDVVTHNMMGHEIVYINNPKLVKEIYRNTNTSQPAMVSGLFENKSKDRNHVGLNYYNIMTFKKILSDDKLKFRYLYKSIKISINKLLESEINKNKTINNLSGLLRPLLFNIMFNTVSGLSIENRNDKLYTEWDELQTKTIQQVTKNLGSVFMQNKLDVNAKKGKEIWRPMLKLRDLFHKFVMNEKNEKLILNEKDSFYFKLLKENNLLNDNETKILKKNNNELLLNIHWEMSAIMVAALDASSRHFELLILTLCRYENIQNKIYNELINIFGNNIELNDFYNIKNQSKLHYLKAFIYETLRMYPPSLVTVDRRALENINIKLDNNKEYCIPKNYIFNINVIACNKNKYLWNNTNNTNQYNIENFLNDKKQFISNGSKLMTFGQGIRSCPGKSLVFKQMQLLISFLIIKYKIIFKNQKLKNQKLSLKFDGIFFGADMKYDVIFQQR